TARPSSRHALGHPATTPPSASYMTIWSRDATTTSRRASPVKSATTGDAQIRPVPGVLCHLTVPPGRHTTSLVSRVTTMSLMVSLSRSTTLGDPSQLSSVTPVSIVARTGACADAVPPLPGAQVGLGSGGTTGASGVGTMGPSTLEPASGASPPPLQPAATTHR